MGLGSYAGMHLLIFKQYPSHWSQTVLLWSPPHVHRIICQFPSANCSQAAVMFLGKRWRPCNCHTDCCCTTFFWWNTDVSQFKKGLQFPCSVCLLCWLSSPGQVTILSIWLTSESFQMASEQFTVCRASATLLPQSGEISSREAVVKCYVRPHVQTSF